MVRTILKIFIRREEDFVVLQRLVGENFHQYRNKYVIAILCMISIAGITAFNAWIMGPIVKNIFTGDDRNMATTLAIAIGIAFAVKGGLGYMQTVILQKIGISIVAQYQRRLFGHLLKLRVGFFNARHSADLIARLNQNIGGG